MYKEEMDRLGFEEGGWFKKLAALGSLFGNVATPPKTEYELHSEQADKIYRNRPADREMFDVTTNYLMEQEDRNIQDAELGDALADVSKNYTNAEPEKFIKNYRKPKPTILSEQILSTIQKNRGWSSEELNALKEFSNAVSKAESDNKIDVHQHGGGPGRGKYQYEIGDEQGASTARNRLLNFAKDNNITISQEYLNLLGQQGIQSIDFSALPEDLQTALFFADKAKHPEFKLDDLVSGRLSPVDAWLAYHWAGKQELREEKKQYFLDKNKLEKRSKLIRYPIGVDTPIFTTQEEADIYMDALPKATRSVVRGIIQGTVKYLGGTSLSSAFELSGRYQAMSPIYEKGLLSREDIEEYEQLPGFLETEAKHTRALGETVVPGDVDEESVWLSETATGLGILGVGIKQGVDLIRHYGPKAVTKLKNYFVKNPESTVDEAVKGVLGKAATRRDVIKGMGTGAVVAGTTSILGKIGMGAGAVGTTAKIASTVPLASATQVINRVPYHILKGSTVFKRHMTGSKNQIVGNKMFNADWTINEKVFDLAPIRVPSQTHRLSTKDLRTGDAYSKYGTWGEIDHIAIRDMPKLKPHFGDKFGLKPNEITTLDVRLQQTEIINPYDWVKGTRLNKRLDSGPGSGATRSKYENLTENLGLVWHENFDLIKLAKENPNKFRRVMDDVRKDKDMPRELIKYIDEVILSPDSTYLGTKNGMEFYQIKGVPMARNTVKELDREVVSFHQLSQFSNIYMPNMKGLERLRGKKFTAKELQELDDLTLSMYTSKFLPE